MTQTYTPPSLLRTMSGHVRRIEALERRAAGIIIASPLEFVNGWVPPSDEVWPYVEYRRGAARITGSVRWLGAGTLPALIARLPSFAIPSINIPTWLMWEECPQPLIRSKAAIVRTDGSLDFLKPVSTPGPVTTIFLSTAIWRIDIGV